MTWLIWFGHRVMHPKDADGMENSVDSYQTIKVYSACSENLRSLL